MNTNNIVLFIICSGLIFFIIGLPTFLLGCNLSISDKCIAYNIFDGYIYERKVYEKTCSKCTKHDKNGKCERTDYHSCWDGYVYARNVNNNNQTTSRCKLKTIDSAISEYNANKSIKKYKIGEHVNWYRKKGTSNCETRSSVINLWYVGVVFLSLTGLAVLLGLIVFILKIIETNQNYNIINNKNNQEINTIEITNINIEKI